MKHLVPFLILFFSVSVLHAQDKDYSTKDIDDLSLQEMMTEDYSHLVEMAQKGRGESGGFGHRLRKISDGFSVNGFITNEAVLSEGSQVDFDNHYLVLFFNTSITEKLDVEAEIEYEHSGSTIQMLYAQTDYEVSRAFIIRAGKFLIPSSPFNEYYYPEFLNKPINRSYINTEISPTVWSGTGIQLRGNFSFNGFKSYYAIYAINGLEGIESQTIREMRSNNDIGQNNIAVNNTEPAYGARVGFETENGLEIGGWIYTGSYSADKKLQLSLGGVDATYRHNNLYVMGEYQLGTKENSTPSDQKLNGYSLTAAYHISAWNIEPVLRFDTIDYDDMAQLLDTERKRITLGINHYITDYTVLKAGYDLILDGKPTQPDNEFALQLSIGF